MSAHIARRHAAKVLVSLSKGEPPEGTITEAVSDGRIEVMIIVAPVRYLVAPSVSLPSFLDEARTKYGVDVRPMSPPAPAAGPEESAQATELSDTDRTVLSVLSPAFKKARTIAIEAGFAPKTASVRVSLAKLVRLGLATNQRSFGYRLS